tara:strand:+ start:1580 stop:4432 length:2853 start_codon:yes stop_codon:yes gene_type:complete
MKNISSSGNTNSSQKLDEFLKNNKSEKGNITHTRIGNKDLTIYGGSYTVNDNEEFLNIYYNHVFVNKNSEYLTEKQLIDDGPLLVDIDFRYDVSINSKQHSKEHIEDLLSLYCTKLSEMYNINDNSYINVYVLEKSSVNVLDDKTKDGIHLIFTLKMPKAHQCVLRKKIINEIGNVWDNLPNTNSFADVFDEGVTKGFVNWQLYGSKKPGHKPYLLKYFYTLTYTNDDGWAIKENNTNINIKEHISYLSARYNNHNKFEVKDNSFLIDAIEKENKELNNKTSNKEVKISLLNKINIDEYDFSKIDNQAQLDNLLENFLENLLHHEYEYKEINDFVMILPEDYFGDGSYSKWIRVGWALKNTHEKMFLTWMKFSSKSSSFNFRDIPEYYQMWKTFDKNNNDGLTSKSIMYWAKNDNYAKYKDIRETTVTYYIDSTVDSVIRHEKVGEFDLAVVLYQLFKDDFICVSIKNNIWYEYKDNKWYEIDSGNTLRLMISKKMHDIYLKKANSLVETITKLENNDQNADNLRTKSGKLGDICVLLKTTSWKNNIMKEAKELFYDKDFLNKLDSNQYLLCFNNYVIDFKEKTYRKGRPDDFISKSTNIDYIPFNKLTGNSQINKNIPYSQIIQEINEFFQQLFPVKELEDYMWDHVASILIGTNENQTFNIYTGSGCNGKSKLVELLSKGLGDYKQTAPITMVTQKRNSVGATSSEIVQLQGVRYAVMQEPSKGDKINEGILKELTGGDPVQGRALFKEPVTFIPQFKLVVCSNVLFDIGSNDDGTWRRIRLCDFMSKFNDAPYENEDAFPKENYPYQYAIDRKIDEKFEYWAPVLMSMLVEKAFIKQGHVKDSNIVLAGSDKYREGQDYLTEFAKDKIVRRRDSKIKKTEILEEFKNWYIMHYGRNNLPNGKEITEYMDKKYGKCNRGKWFNVEIKYDDESEDEDDNEDFVRDETNN